MIGSDIDMDAEWAAYLAWRRALLLFERQEAAQAEAEAEDARRRQRMLSQD